ncbi:hypothetical protein AB1Y20_013285 [Prymnesium parvum]|uniref:Anoctamin transmembrane domain-containing protein n=1 Tax=Prymnesium parvum TaxID=97485 RepID=A0AB34INU6_PRYPA
MATLTMSARIDHEEEARIEKLDQEQAASGCAADIVFVFPIEDEETLKAANKAAMEAVHAQTGLKAHLAKLTGNTAENLSKGHADDISDLTARNEQRAETITKMRTVGLTVVKQKTRDGKKMLVKVTAPLRRLEKEAQRLGIEMRLKEEFNDPDRPDVSTYRDFDVADRDDFQRKEGRLFSTLERQRLIFSILEGPQFEGCAQLDLDGLVNEKIFSLYTAIHNDKERQDLLAYWASWSSFRLWPCKLYGKSSRIWPDLGAIEQPLNMVRDYFGEKVTLYFAWMEHYTLALLALSLCAILQAFVSSAGDTGNIVATVVYCGVVAIWSTVYSESWKRYNAELAYTWDVQDFEEEEQPRPEFLRAYYEGRYRGKEFGGKGAMTKQHGFYGSDGAFIKHSDGEVQITFSTSVRHRVYAFLTAPGLLVAVACTSSGSLALLTARMIWSISIDVKRDSPFFSQNGALVASILNVLWIQIMNNFYRKLARTLNDLENFRTETEYNDLLILKTFFFQFFNSYLSCFYVAFIKGNNVSLFAAFGSTDKVTGKTFADMCGKRVYAASGLIAQPWLNADPLCANGTVNVLNPDDAIPDNCNMILQGTDCMDDLNTLMFSYTFIKYLYDLPLQLFIPWFTGFINTYLLEKQMKKKKSEAGDVEMVKQDAAPLPPAVGKFHEKLETELAEPAYGGTFAEFNTKVLQFGYIALFSAAFPLGALASAIANAIELRIDALKLFEVRRPRYVGAEDIGSWQRVVEALGWVALFVNVALLAFTSFKLRDNILIPIVGNGTNCESPAEMSANFGLSSYNYTTSWSSLYESGFGERFDPITQGVSYASRCTRNVAECYDFVGGKPYLPAFLSYQSTFTYPDDLDRNYTVTFLGLGQFAGNKGSGAPSWYNRFLDLTHIDPDNVPTLNRSVLPSDPPGTLWQLLPIESSTTVPYSEAICQNVPYGIGDAAVPNYLYDVSHCNICASWMREVSVARLIFLMIVEHLLLFLKVFLALAIPDKPKWVVRAEARADFAKETIRKKGSIHVLSTEENAAFIQAKKQVFDSIVDDDPVAPSGSVTGRI